MFFIFECLFCNCHLVCNMNERTYTPDSLDGIKILQWNSRSIASNLLSFEHFISCESYSILALQSLNVDRKKMPKLNGYYFPPICECDRNSKVKSAIYIRQGLAYEQLSSSSSPLPPATEDMYYTGVIVKINKDVILKIISLYLPQGPKNDNTDWIKNIDISNEKWVILGDFNAHAPFWDSECNKITSNRLVENIVNSKLYLLNDGSLTRMPDVVGHKLSAIDFFPHFEQIFGFRNFS